MFLTGLATAVPPRRYTQADCWMALQGQPAFESLAPRSRALLKKVLGGGHGIATRHLAAADLSEMFTLTPDALHARFADYAPRLATEAALRALEQARVAASEIDAVLVSTCTGYLCPGLSSYLVERLGLGAGVHALDLVGQGCGAAIPNGRTARALLAAGARYVLSICVEICSAAFYLDDEPGVLISNCLFGDGAAAAVWSTRPARHTRRVQWVAHAGSIVPAERERLRFEYRGGMLRNILSPDVPALAAHHAGRALKEVLARGGIDQKTVTGWILHAGGSRVLEALMDQLGLSKADVRRSAAVLREYGNLSSPFVHFVLERALADAAPGGRWWMSAFGAGFSCHGALLEVE